MVTDCLATTIPHRCKPYSPFDTPTTDANGEENADEKEFETIRAHEGILASSIKLCQELQPFLEEQIQEGCTIDLVGHSLGAGSAAVAAVLLRSRYKELHDTKRLHAYCFAAPPVLDLHSARRSKGFITSVVNRSDCVTRMSIVNAEILIRMLEGLQKKIKEDEELNTVWGILKELAFGTLVNTLSDENFYELVDIMRQAQDAVEINDNENLFVPGTIIAMYGTMSEMPEKGEEAEVTIRSAYIDPAHAFLRYFEMNERMVNDHLIPAYDDSFKGCIESRTKAENMGEKSKSPSVLNSFLALVLVPCHNF